MKTNSIQKTGIAFLLLSFFSLACLLVTPYKWAFGTVLVLSLIGALSSARIYRKRKT